MSCFERCKLVPAALEDVLVRRLDMCNKLGLIAEGKIRGPNDQPYRCPNPGQLVDFILNRRVLLEHKAKHGFTDVEICPSVSSEQWLGALRTTIMTHANNLKSSWGLSLSVNAVAPVRDLWYADPGLPLFYQCGTKWVTTQEFYDAQPFPGLHLAFVRPADDEMPRCQTQGAGDTGGRPNLSGGISPINQYDIFGSGAYQHESAFTVEIAMARMLHSIQEQQVVLYAYGMERGMTVWCSRNRFGANNTDPLLSNLLHADVPCLRWDIDNGWLDPHANYSGSPHWNYAAPAAVGLEA